MPDKKFISPGTWFSMIYPGNWEEFKGNESTFLFYDPINWSGNFRISAYKKDINSPDAMFFGRESVQDELKSNPMASLVKVGGLDCAYSQKMFQDESEYYVSHLWITGIENVSFECSFTVHKGGDTSPAEKIIETLQTRKEGVKYPAEIIPVRVSEINDIDEAYEWVSSTVRKQLKKDFQGAEEDLLKIQQVIDMDLFPAKKREVWLSFGIAVCMILANEIEGMEWKTLIDGNREAPVLQYGKTQQIIDPMHVVWSKIKAGNRCRIEEEYKKIIESL